MTAPATPPGLEERLRDRVDLFREYLSEVGVPPELPYTAEDADRDTQAADALAKARVALEWCGTCRHIWNVLGLPQPRENIGPQIGLPYR